MKVGSLTVTEAGRRLAERLPYPHHHGRPSAWLAEQWGELDGVVAVMALGAVVRLVAPLLGHKERDPALVCVDDGGHHAVVVCGAHHGGNALAKEVAGLLGATPVLTTATEARGLPALDQLPGCGAEGDLAAVSTALLDGLPVSCDNPLGWPLPPAFERQLDAARPEAPGQEAARLVVSHRLSEGAGDALPTVRLRPPCLVLGVGTSTTASEEELASHASSVLADAGLATSCLAAVATIDRRAEHPAVEALVARLGVPLETHSSGTLARVEVPSPSAQVARAVGTPSVAEAAALASAGPGGTLLVAKTARSTVTVAVAQRARPTGHLSVVGIGPGGVAQRTSGAVAALTHAEVVVGFHGYLELCADLLRPAQEVLGSPLGQELERAHLALQLAREGRRVALVCSGDPGVYAMASPLLELAATEGAELPALNVVPGVTAAQAAAAALGAPLGHDHAVVSLSDLHTPWPLIRRRVAAAAAADLVLVLYNPRSERRHWQLEEVRGMLLRCRRPQTPVGLVRRATRPDENVSLSTLSSFDAEQVDMTTLVVVGSSATQILGGLMVTPRGYKVAVIEEGAR